MTEIDVRIRRATHLEDYIAVVDLQKEVWKDDAHLATLPLLLLANKWGGCVLVAEDTTGSLIGFSFAILGQDEDGVFWWSHMTAVTESWRFKGAGLLLKMRQREEALAGGVSRILWTFDPLQAMNAHFNIHKLGAVVRKYEENVYGISNSPLHRGLPTDRFIAEWHLNSERVQQRMNSEGAVILRDIDRIPRIEESGLKDDLLLLEVPVDIAALKQSDMAKAREWQDKLRAAAQHYFAAGYVITDFIFLNQPRTKAFYLLELSRTSAP